MAKNKYQKYLALHGTKAKPQNIILGATPRSKPASPVVPEPEVAPEVTLEVTLEVTPEDADEVMHDAEASTLDAGSARKKRV